MPSNPVKEDTLGSLKVSVLTGIGGLNLEK